MDFRLKRYKKEYKHSYAIGVYPTLELLEHTHPNVICVVIHPNGKVNKGAKKIQGTCEELEIPIHFEEKTFKRIGARDNDFAFGVFKKELPQLIESENHIVLVNPMSKGNLGTIMRTMVGFGFLNLSIIQPSSDIYHPDVVRASMGAIFQLHIENFQTFNEYCESFEQNIYTLMTNGKKILNEETFIQPFCLVFGNESSGLNETFHSLGNSVKIPQNNKIDSLNLAVAAGITMYQTSNR